MERLDKVISNLGYGSRKEIKQLARKGLIEVDGEIIKDSGYSVDPEKSIIKVNGEEIFYRKYIYLMMNKPAGVVSATFDNRDETVIDLLEIDHQAFEPFPVGRLDKESDGLILLTNDGDMMDRILRSVNGHEKEYIVSVNRPIDDTFIKRMSEGIYLEELERTTKKCVVRKVSDRTFRIILTQGLNRQIRRMCDALGYKVTKLTRIRIMNIELGELAVGQYRELTESEVTVLKEQLYK